MKSLGFYQRMKLLDTGSGNTKIKKTNTNGEQIRMAGLSLLPDDKLCPASKAAGCRAPCLVVQGRGVCKNVIESRQNKVDYFNTYREEFLSHLVREITNFEALCLKTGVKPVVRLNVMQDIAWERLGIVEKFPGVFFLDYTKRANRLGNMPENYKLIFSYSGRKQYQAQVREALKHDEPIAAVFRDKMPETFLGRPVVNGDASDYLNVLAGPVVVGLVAKGSARKDTSGFVVDAG